MWINPILHGGGSSGPPLEVYLAWRLSGRSDGAQISWLCFFLHLLCPIEATFQKKFLEIWKIAKIFFDRSDIKGSPLWKKKIFAINHTFSIWIWILYVLSFLLMYITYTFIKIFDFSLFYYEFSVDYQLHSLASHSKNSHQKSLFLVPMDC